MVAPALLSSQTDEWSTPQALFDELNSTFKFTLDPCATPENAKCAKFYTKEQDGLKQDWSGETIWCNPPLRATYWRMGKEMRGALGRGRDAHPSQDRHEVVA